MEAGAALAFTTSLAVHKAVSGKHRLTLVLATPENVIATMLRTAIVCQAAQENTL